MPSFYQTGPGVSTIIRRPSYSQAPYGAFDGRRWFQATRRRNHETASAAGGYQSAVTTPYPRISVQCVGSLAGSGMGVLGTTAKTPLGSGRDSGSEAWATCFAVKDGFFEVLRSRVVSYGGPGA
jgi:hypothetical protein